jgi:hypothetical protein
MSSDYENIKFNIESQQTQMQQSESWGGWAMQEIFNTDFHAANNIFRSMENNLSSTRDREEAISDIQKREKEGNLSRTMKVADTDGNGKADTIIGVVQDGELVFDNPYNDLDKRKK